VLRMSQVIRVRIAELRGDMNKNQTIFVLHNAKPIGNKAYEQVM